MNREISRFPERHRERPWRNRLFGWLFTAGVHLIVFAALFWPHAPSASRVKPPLPPMTVTLLDVPEPKPPAPTDAGASETAARPAPLHIAEPMPLVVIAVTPAPDTSDVLSESQLARATSVGEEGAGANGGCDTARAVQQALRRDPLVRPSVEKANRLGKIVMLWNGDWVQSGGEDGKGLSAVREAVMWEVGFAPAACRNQRMHGLVVLSLADGDTRFAIGADDWRWSDLLSVRGAAR